MCLQLIDRDSLERGSVVGLVRHFCEPNVGQTQISERHNRPLPFMHFLGSVGILSNGRSVATMVGSKCACAHTHHDALR